MARSESVVVIGGGPTGMAAAMILAKREVPVILIERDRLDAFGRTEEYPPLRPGAPHYNRPHTLRAGGRDVLLRSLPEVAREVYALGARDTVEWPGSPRAGRPPLLVFRRSLLERALLSGARKLPALNLRFGERVLDLTVTEGRVSGVVTTSGTWPARLVIDASGPRGKVLGRFSSPQLSLWSPLFYTSQPFLLTSQGFANTQGATAVWIKPPSEPVAHVRLFLHDQPYASVLVVLHGRTDPPGRELVRQAYKAVLRHDDLRQYLDGAVPLAPVQTLGFTRSRLRLLDAQPRVHGIHQIGDALMTVEPLTSKGLSLGFIQAEILANAISSDIGNFAAQRDAVVNAYHDWLVPHWAEGLLRGSYLEREPDVPSEWLEYVVAARRRGRQARDIRAASRRSADVNRDRADLMVRFSRLQVPASATEGVSR